MAASSGGSAINLNRVAPVIDYTSLDFDALKADFVVYAQTKYSDTWTDFNPTQFAVILLENVVYVGDLVTFYLNAGLRECKLYTAQRRSSAVYIARQLDYVPGSASSAGAQLTVTSNPAALPYAMPAASTKFGAGSVVFQPDQDYTITVTPQTISVLEGEQYANVLLGASDGTRSISKTVPNSPLIDGTLVVNVNGIPWTKVDTLTTQTPGDSVYMVVTDDEDIATVQFGDGVNGKIPPAGQAITASYKIGGGVQGRVGPGAIKSLISVPAGCLSVTNPARATGGDDGETLAEIKVNAPAALSAGDRCVTLPDFASAALRASSSVAKAVAQNVDSRTCRLVIAPSGGGAPSDALQNVVATYVASRRVPGYHVQMDVPTYVSIEVEADLFLVKSAIAPAVLQTARSLFLTANVNQAQNGLLDFDNVGFAAKSSDGTPQITRRSVTSMLDQLRPRGVQEVRLRKLTTKPQLRARGFVSATDAAMVFTTNRPEDLLRRRWRVVFTSPTTYNVFEGIEGFSTQLARRVLTDDRAQFPSLVGLTAQLCPSITQSVFYDLNEAACTGTALTLQNTTDDMYSVAVVGSQYRVEWPGNAVSGVVGVAYTPLQPDGEPHGFTWTINGTTFNAGDQFTIDVFANADDLLLADDEIPQLADADLVINIASAYV